MSDDVTNLAEVLAAHHQAGYTICHCGAHLGEVDARSSTWADAHRAHVAEVLAPLIADARLIGAAMADTDAIAAYAELVERVEALAAKWDAIHDRIAPVLGKSPSGQVQAFANELRALIDPEATP